MRKLGHGQSIMFFAPLEIDRSIRKAANKGPSVRIEVADILRWSMLETCLDIEHHIPHWAQQGLDYSHRSAAWRGISHSPDVAGSVEPLKATWLQIEGRSLEMMYGVKRTGGTSLARSNQEIFDLPELRERLETLGVSHIAEVDMDEEQEREVNHEIEQERQIERPPKALPASPNTHPDALTLIETGAVPNGSDYFAPLFTSILSHHFARLLLNNNMWSQNLITTRDFAITIRRSGPGHDASEYLKPVNWILSSRRSPVLVVLSSFEVNHLLPLIRSSNNVTLHSYAPRVTREMKAFDDLKFHCIPSLPQTWTIPNPLMISQLNLFAGQLYLHSNERYFQLCAFLGIYTGSQIAGVPITTQSDGFVRPVHRQGVLLPECPFTESPIPFLKELIGLRRKGNTYLPTHIGKVIHGRLLTEDDFS